MVGEREIHNTSADTAHTCTRVSRRGPHSVSLSHASSGAKTEPGNMAGRFAQFPPLFCPPPAPSSMSDPLVHRRGMRGDRVALAPRRLLGC